MNEGLALNGYQKIKGYSECPDDIDFYIDAKTVNKENMLWFEQAMEDIRLMYTLDGGLRTLRSKGKTMEIAIIPVANPLSDIPDVTYYISEHGNYHLGRSAADRNDYYLLRSHNRGDYHHYQNSQFFLAIRNIFRSNKLDIYTLYISKKAPSSEPPRAQQD